MALALHRPDDANITSALPQSIAPECPIYRATLNESLQKARDPDDKTRAGARVLQCSEF